MRPEMKSMKPKSKKKSMKKMPKALLNYFKSMKK
jgi:hypothetical protein